MPKQLELFQNYSPSHSYAMDSIFCDVELVQVYEESSAFSCPEHFADHLLELFHNFQEHPETDTPSFEDFLEDFKLFAEFQ